jgi:Reverse transcriptase (RNA-dependent DNA polymerase)
MLTNYEFKYQARDKFIFVPNEASKNKGHRLIRYFEKRDVFPVYFYHYKEGGHVSALHIHIQNRFFFKIDIEHFYYSISRNRVAEALRRFNFQPSGTFAKWSCVPNPYDDPRYALPIGFIQSPLLASVVLLGSPVADAIERARERGVFVSVYFDDFVGSSNDEALLKEVYLDLLKACGEANFVPNVGKLTEPSPEITAFNCNVAFGRTYVTPERIDQFYAKGRTENAIQSFEKYRAMVAAGNTV